MTRLRRGILRGGVCALAMVANIHAARAESDAADPADPGTTATEGLQSVIVTAQKFSQNLQKAPAAVTPLSAEELIDRGVTDLPDVQALVPSARFQVEGQTVQVFLRGVGSNLDFGNIDQTVAFNINGVYIPREGTSVPLFDLQEIEVLPGPQGTLYGRGSLGGAINVSFARPNKSWESSAILETGNYDLIHAEAVQNAPLSDTLSVRAAIDSENHSGYLTDGSDSRHDIAGRLSLLYEPNEDLTLYGWGYIAEKHGDPPNLVNKGFDPATGAYSENAYLQSNPYDNSRTGALSAFAPFGQPGRQPQLYHNYVAGAQLDYRLTDDVTLTYIPTYFFLDSNDNFYLGDIDTHKRDKYNQHSQELRLSGNTGNWRWIGGAYWYELVGDSYFYFLPIPVVQTNILDNLKEGEAAFGQATYSLSDALRLTVGGRYSVDHRKANGISALGLPYDFDHTFSNFDYKFGVEYDLTPKVMTYATYQTGYQPGTFNELPNTATYSNLVKSARLSAVTAGIKTRFFDDTLQINDEVFYYRYHDLVMQSYDQNVVYNPVFNADLVEIPGDQLDIIVKPTARDQANLSIGYTHARDSNFVTPDGSNYAGYQPPYASDWSISLGLQHDFDIPTGFVRARFDTRYESSFFADFIHHPGTYQPGYDKTDLSLTYFNEDGHWTFGAWVKNVSNTVAIAATAFGGIPGPSTAYLQDPRTYGVRLTANY